MQENEAACSTRQTRRKFLTLSFSADTIGNMDNKSDKGASGNRWRRFLILAILFALVVIVIKPFGCANRMFFWPDRGTYTGKDEMPFEVRDVYFKSEDGTKLHAWFCRAKGEKVKGAVFHLHGNAQNLTSHVRLVSWLPLKGYHVFAWDYRGYGKSEGSPTKSGLVKDTRAALEAFLNLPEIKDRNIPLIVFGQSLGAAYGGWIASEHPDAFDAVILDAPFTSHQGIAIDALQRNPVTWILSWPLGWLLVSSGQDPVECVKKIRVPVLVIHGKADHVIPHKMGVKVYKAANEPKEFLSHSGGHLFFDSETEKRRVHKGILDFLDKHF